MVDMIVLYELLPLIPTDPIFSTIERSCRAPLTGAIVAFAEFLQKTCVFDLECERAPLEEHVRLYLTETLTYVTEYVHLMNTFNEPP
jgi:hypothetical protein